MLKHLVLYFTIALTTTAPVIGQESSIYPNLEQFLPFYRSIRDAITDSFGNPEQHKILLEDRRKIGSIQDKISDSAKFFCDFNGPGQRSPTAPTSVHKLRPGDIDIVAGLGDSITAGNGLLVNDISGILFENRGLSFTSGGESNWREFLTLPNILKEYNQNLTGFAEGNAPGFSKKARFNIGEHMAMSRDLTHQVQLLYKRMKSDPKVDMQKHWKVITIFMGHNDFCSDNCFIGNFSEIIKNHRRDVLKTLRFIRDNIPKAFVNYLPLANLKELLDIKGGPHLCDMLHIMECACMFNSEFKGATKKAYYDLLTKWIQTDYDVVAKAEFHNKEDFEVVLQPVVTFGKLPKLQNGLNDLRYQAFDCFHFSQRGHAALATMLWNNMLQPVGKKEMKWVNEFEFLECPSEERPYFATIKNS